MAAERVLHVLGGLGMGGAESRIMDLYRAMDREKIQFDFLVHQAKKEHYYEEIIGLGGKVYVLPRFRIYNYFSYRKAVKDFFREHHDYTVVQGHMTSTASIYLPIAKKMGVKTTVAHARSAGVDKGIKGLATKLLRKNLWKRTDYCFSCSKLAGEAVFGAEQVAAGKVFILPNAIDAGKFVFSPTLRREVRQELGIEGKFVIGHVGRFNHMKNHSFLLDVVAEIKKTEKRVVLLCLGEGSLMEEMKEKAERLQLTENVLFLGNKSQPERYYQAMDYFVFPSVFEGLPGTVVEAQAAGLRCLISSTITEEVALSPLVTFHSLEQSPAEWADFILQNREYERTQMLPIIEKAGFDVQTQVAKMTKFYQGGVWEVL